MFGLWGGIYGSTLPRVVMTLSQVETVTVTVSVIMWTCGGIKLRTAPSLENFFLKNGEKELKQARYVSAYTVILKTSLNCVFQVLIVDTCQLAI